MPLDANTDAHPSRRWPADPPTPTGGEGEARYARPRFAIIASGVGILPRKAV